MDIKREKRKLNSIHYERNYYKCFKKATLAELQTHIVSAQTREEKAFYRALLNLKLQLSQEDVVGRDLV